MIDAIVVAAGRSERMGIRNKLTLRLHQGTIISNVIYQLSRSQANQIIVVVGHEHKAIINALKAFPDIIIVYNSRYRTGQMTSIKAGLSALVSCCEGFLICLGDMPTISSAEYDMMISAYHKAHSTIDRPIVRPVYKESLGHPVIFHHTYKSDIIDAPATENCRSVIDQHKESYHPVLVSSVNFFLDIDNEEQYNRLIHYTP